jgi:hypothetical protein
MAVIYYKSPITGATTTNNVPDGDVSYWQSQGWTASPPSASAPAASPSAPVANTPAPTTQNPSLPAGFSTNASGQIVRIGAASLPSSPATQYSIPWMQGGLRDAQGMSDLQNQVDNVPLAQWSDAWKRVWSTYTGGAPLPVTNVTSSSQTASATPAPTATTPATPATATPATAGSELAKLKTNLQGYGIDITGLDDNQVQSLGMMYQVMQLNADKNKAIVPASLSVAEMDKFLADAKTELSPYYQEQFDVFKSSLNESASFLSGEFQQQQAEQAQQFQQQGEQLGVNMADSGLGRSGIRVAAEARLRDQQQGLVTSQRRGLGSTLTKAGLESETQFGPRGATAFSEATKPINDLYPTLAYKPMGVKIGQFPGQQVVAEKARQNQLAQEALLKKPLTS